MKKKYCIIVVMMVLLATFGNNVADYLDNKNILDKEEIKKTNCSNIDISSDNSYEIYFETFSSVNKLTHTNIQIKYPQLKGMVSDKLEIKINNLIKEKAISVYNTKDSEGLTLPMDTSVEFFNSNIISIKYSGYGYYYGAINGNNIMYATNINLKTGEIIDIKDLFNDDFKNMLNRNIFRYNGADKVDVGKEIEPNSQEYEYTYADTSIVEQMFENYYNNMRIDKYYLSDTEFNLIMNTPSGPTIYLELAASYDDLESCMNINNELWNDIKNSR